MRRVLRFLVRLYPARWRERYGDEFRSLLEDCAPRPADLFDVLRGGIEMQVRYWTLGKTLTLFVMAGALVGFTIAASRPERYVSKAVLELGAQSSDDVLRAFHRATGHDFENVKSQIYVILRKDGRFEVSFRSNDAKQGQSTHEALVRKLTDAGRFGLVEPPSTFREPVAPTYGLAIISGIAGGLLLGLGAALWRRSSSRVAT